MNDNYDPNEDGWAINFYQDDAFSISPYKEESLEEWAKGEFNTPEEVEEFLSNSRKGSF